MTMSSAGRLGQTRAQVSRRGSIQRVVLAVVALGAVSAAAYTLLSTKSESVESMPLLGDVVRGPYEHIVLEQGEVESSNNVEVVCKVKNRAGANSPATRILDVIPEGTMVQEGDWLVTFDSNALENELIQQTITAKTAETCDPSQSGLRHGRYGQDGIHQRNIRTRAENKPKPHLCRGRES